MTLEDTNASILPCVGVSARAKKRLRNYFLQRATHDHEQGRTVMFYGKRTRV